MADLSGKTALVTGASKGIGAAIARRYAAAGARVMVHYGTDNEGALAVLASLDGEGHGTIQADVSHPEAIQRMIDSTVAEFGSIDILVNNAGIYENQPFDMESYDDWQTSWKRTIDTNLMSAANATHAAIAHMLPRGGGKIINVASRAAFRGETDAPAYAVSKAGMVSLTRCLARAMSPKGILAYCIAPGWVETAMAREGMETMAEEIVSQIPLGRIASVEDVAGVALFFASKDADYLTGTTMLVAGGSWLST